MRPGFWLLSHLLADIADKLHPFAPGCHTWLMVDGVAEGYQAYEDAIARYPAEKLADEPAGQYMLYSSGTTGRPKGVIRPPARRKIYDDAGPVAAMQRNLWGVTDSSIYLSPAPSITLRHCRFVLVSPPRVER